MYLYEFGFRFRLQKSYSNRKSNNSVWLGFDMFNLVDNSFRFFTVRFDFFQFDSISILGSFGYYPNSKHPYLDVD